MDGIKLTYKGIDRQIKRFDRVRDVVEDPRMSPIARAIGGVWERNFNSEGSMVGGWRDLSTQTQQLRESRGFGRAHPILEQYGGLRNAAITSVLRLRGGSDSHTEDGAAMTYTDGQRRFELRVAGRKVSNQFRQQSRRRGSAIYSAPPRRFWFVNQAVVEAAQDALLKSIHEDLRGIR